MRNSISRNLLVACLAALVVFAQTLASSAQPTTSVNIVNNSTRSIRHVYTSHVNADDWSGDQITTAIAPGQSATISNVACDQQQVRIIGENEDGCFVYTVVACGSSGTWTITANTAVDCGQ